MFGLINKISAEEESGLKQIHAILASLLGFAEKNPGMTRVLIGDALVNEDERLQARINQLHDRLEATLKQCLRVAATQDDSGRSLRPIPARRRTCCFATSSAAGTSTPRAASSACRRNSWEKQWPLLA